MLRTWTWPPSWSQSLRVPQHLDANRPIGLQVCPGLPAFVSRLVSDPIARLYRPTDPLETVFLLAHSESPLAALHHGCDLLAHSRNVNRAFKFDLAARLFTSLTIVTADHQLDITIHDEVGVVTREDELTTSLRGPNVFRDL